MNKQLLDKFLKRQVVVSVKTQQEWNDFMLLLEKETDAVWAGGYKPTEINHWGINKERTTVSCWYMGRALGYAGIDWHRTVGLEVIDFQELKGETKMNTAEKLRFLAEINALRQEIEELRLANASLEALVDARFTEHDWFESVGTK